MAPVPHAFLYFEQVVLPSPVDAHVHTDYIYSGVQHVSLLLILSTTTSVVKRIYLVSVHNNKELCARKFRVKTLPQVPIPLTESFTPYPLNPHTYFFI